MKAIMGKVTEFRGMVGKDHELFVTLEQSQTVVLVSGDHFPDETPQPKADFKFDGKAVELKDLPGLLMGLENDESVEVEYEADPVHYGAVLKAEFKIVCVGSSSPPTAKPTPK